MTRKLAYLSQLYAAALCVIVARRRTSHGATTVYRRAQACSGGRTGGRCFAMVFGRRKRPDDTPASMLEAGNGRLEWHLKGRHRKRAFFVDLCMAADQLEEGCG